MDIIVRRATVDDVENIVNNRMDFLFQVIGNQQSVEFKDATERYLYEHINGNSLLCYLAICDKQIVSSVIVCLYNVIPKPSNMSGKIGYVFNVFTLKEFCGQGLATRLMKAAIDESRQLGVGEIYLSATDAGKGIYERLGFQILHEEMCLKLIEK